MIGFLSNAKFVAIFSFVLCVLGIKLLYSLVPVLQQQRKFNDVVAVPMLGADPSDIDVYIFVAFMAFLTVLRFLFVFLTRSKTLAAVLALSHVVLVAGLGYMCVTRVVLPAGGAFAQPVVTKTTAHVGLSCGFLFVHWTYYRSLQRDADADSKEKKKKKM